jgi:hypothetical protein
MTVEIRLCVNCLLQDDVQAYSIGPERGSQRDPYRNTISLCKICREALDIGNFATLAARHTDERVVQNPTVS